MSKKKKKNKINVLLKYFNRISSSLKIKCTQNEDLCRVRLYPYIYSVLIIQKVIL